MAIGRGRVLKAKQVSNSPASVPWEPKAPAEEGPPAEIDVVRERGTVTAIVVRCRCGRVHDLELVPPQQNP